jgi:NADH/NAD ratio-sensing transcriptional regulator Rex
MNRLSLYPRFLSELQIREVKTVLSKVLTDQFRFNVG